MAERFSNPVVQYLDTNGDPIGGGKMFFFESGTSTPLDTFSDDALAVANTNPVILDGDGRTPSIFLQNAAYKVRLDSASDVQIWERDPVATTGDPIGGVSTYAALKALNVTLLTIGQTIYIDGRTTSGDGGEGHFRATQTNPGADNDGTILHSDTAGWFFVRQDIFWFNVKWFGAEGDDSTNDTTAITNCINATAASSAVNQGVIFPAGIYRVTALIFKNASSADIYTFKSLGGAIIKGTSATGDVVTITGDRVHMVDIDVSAHTTRTTSGNGVTVTGDNCELTRVKATGHPGIGISVAGEGSVIDNCEGVQNTGTSEMLISGGGHTIISPTLTRVAATGLGICLDLQNDRHTVIGGIYSNSNIGIDVDGSVCNIFSPQFVGDGTTAMATGVNLSATSSNCVVQGIKPTYTNVTNAVVVSGSSSGNVTVQDGNTIHFGGLRADEGLELGSGGPTVTTGTGTPEGVVTAPQGSTFQRSDGASVSLTIYHKVTGSGNTGWLTLTGWIKHTTVHTSVTGVATLDWTGIPVGVTQIKIVYRDQSAVGGENMAVRLGDSGGFETSAYSGRVFAQSTGTTWSAFADVNRGASAADGMNGEISIRNITGNVWGINGTTVVKGGSSKVFGGSKLLSGVLTQVRLLLDSGGNFDAGDFALYYQ